MREWCLEGISDSWSSVVTLSALTSCFCSSTESLLALRESETETILFNPHTVSVCCVIIIPYVTLLRYEQVRGQYPF
jgi:hypothetical protein